jgi:hypothetical protein
MVRKSIPKAATRVGRRSANLGWAAPVVVHERLSRFARSAAAPTLADQLEFQRMFAEKWMAAWQSAWGMGLAAWTGRPLSASTWWRVWDAGLAPVETRAVANMRRLKRRR